MLILTAIWRAICSYHPSEAGGQGWVYSSHSGHCGCPPQVVENGMIIGVSDWPKSAFFSAGIRLAKMGNTLGHLPHGSVMQRTARGLQLEHLSRKNEQRAKRPKRAQAG
jgi:hypothetical protein